MQRNREAEENRVNKALKGGKGGNDEDNQELEKKRFEYKLRMDTEQHEKMLMDEARLQLIEVDIKRVEVTLNEALVAVEKVKDEEGERRDFVQKELSVFLDEFAIKDYEVQSRRESLCINVIERVRSGVDYREERGSANTHRGRSEARRIHEVAEKPTEERGGTKSEVGPRPFRGRAKVGRDEISFFRARDEVKTLEDQRLRHRSRRKMQMRRLYFSRYI